MIQDGRYAVFAQDEGSLKLLGHIVIANGELSYPSFADEHNIDMFRTGPLTKHTSDKLQAMIDGNTNAAYTIKKV